MSIFSAASAVATATLHATMGEAAVYFAPPAAGLAVTVVPTPIDQELQLPGFEVSARAAGQRWELMRREVAVRPVAGTDYIVKDARTYRIRSVEERPDWWVLDISEG